MRRSKDSKAAKVASQKILGNYLQRQAVAQRLHWQTQAMESVARVGTEGLHQLIRGGGRGRETYLNCQTFPKLRMKTVLTYLVMTVRLMPYWRILD